MGRPRRDSRQQNGITLRGLSQPTFATKSAHLRHAEMSAPWLLLEGKRTLPSVDCKPLQQVPKEPDGPVKERNRVTVTNSLRASYAGRAVLFCRASARQLPISFRERGLGGNRRRWLN